MADENKNNDNQVFRQKSMDRVSSPEALNDIIKVANPGVWILITAIIVLLVGALCWGILGRLETSVDIAIRVENKTALVFVKEEDISKVKTGQEVKTDKFVCKVAEIPDRAQKATEYVIKDEYIAHILGASESDWVYVLEVFDVPAENGVYTGRIVTESISPISLIFN